MNLVERGIPFEFLLENCSKISDITELHNKLKIIDSEASMTEFEAYLNHTGELKQYLEIEDG